MCAAVQERRNWSESNTRVDVLSCGSFHVYLHNNLIYREVAGRKMFTLAGWNTNTTKSRLRALGVDVESKRRGVYYNGKEISSREWHNV